MKKVFLFILALLFTFCVSGCVQTVQTAQRGFEGGFIIDGEEYVSMTIGFTEEGKTIAKVDGYVIKEIPEDKDHNFLAVRNFLDNWTIVKASYVIPTSGKLNVAYCDYERITDGAKMRMVQSILDDNYQDNFQIKTEAEFDIYNATDSVMVGYEDCPVGTDWIGRIGNINGRLVFVKVDDIRDGDLLYTCYILNDEYQDLYANRVHRTFETVRATALCTSPSRQHEYTHEIVEPGCVDEGYTIFTCSICGYHFVSNEAEPYGHAYEIVDEKDGKNVYACMRCGDMYVEE